MHGIWWIFNATRRRRWAAWIALSLLIALVGGAVLTGASAARATQHAFPDYERHYGADIGIFEVGAPYSAYARLGGVSSYVAFSSFFTGNAEAGSTFVPEQDLSVLTPPVSGTEPPYRLLSGRLPHAANEVMAGFSLEQDASLHLGSTIKMVVAGIAQQQEIDRQSGNVVPHGPTFTFRVVGFFASILDFPSSSPSYTVITSVAFANVKGPNLAKGVVVLARLHGGTSSIPRYAFEVKSVAERGGFAYSFPISLVANVVNGSLHPLVVGWWLFALLACLVGLALIAQALSRQSIVERLTYPALSSLGVSPGQLFWLGMIRAGAVGVVGAGGAVAISVLASPFTLFGEARAAEPSQGFVVDVAVLGVGGAAIVLFVLLLAVLPCWQASRARSLFGARESLARRTNPVAALVARAGAPPSMLVGVRHALERGRGRASVPVATALFGTVAAVVALVGSSVFGASLSTLLATPRLWGQAWQLDMGGFSGPDATSIFTSLARSPQVIRDDYGVANQEIAVNGVSVGMVAYMIAKGPPVFVNVAGHDPIAPGQIALGTSTAAETRATVGSMVRVSIIGPDGKASTGELRVVGVIAVPPSLSGGSVGDGSVMLLSSVFGLFCGEATANAACRTQVAHVLEGAQTHSAWGGAVEFKNTSAAHALLAATQRRYAAELTLITRPTALTNFGGGINFPLLLGLTMALFGVATLVHLMVVSVSRRRREHAVLKVLGFIRRQVRAAVCWQAVTIAAVGVVVGVPLGIAAGRVAWRAFTGSQGVLDDTVVPVVSLVLIGAGVFVAAIVISLGPTVLATRLRPAAALRDE